MLPTLILFAFFVWEPLLESVRLSLFNANGYQTTQFVGLANYKSLFANPDFLIAWKNTLLYIVWSLIIGFLVPIFMAVMITEAPGLKGFSRVAVYLPNIMPGLAIVLIWMFFFKPGPTGVLNIFGSWVGAEPFSWLSAKGWTIPLIVLTMTWKSAGATSLIYMAGISRINPDIIDAATIDGATPFARFFHIVLPDLLGLAKILLILQIISVFQILYEPLMMTNGGPNNASVSIMMQVYKYAFDQFNYPKAAAVSVMICIVLVFLTILYFGLTRKVKSDD